MDSTCFWGTSPRTGYFYLFVEFVVLLRRMQILIMPMRVFAPRVHPCATPVASPSIHERECLDISYFCIYFFFTIYNCIKLHLIETSFVSQSKFDMGKKKQFEHVAYFLQFLGLIIAKKIQGKKIIIFSDIGFCTILPCLKLSLL